MSKGRWDVVKELLKNWREPGARMVLAVAPEPLVVALYETMVLAENRPQLAPLRGFVQESIRLLGAPTAAEIARLLHLPLTVAEVALGNLARLGGVAFDPAGRCVIPAGAPDFTTQRPDTGIWIRRKETLYYWPKHGAFLPLIPQMRPSDFVKLNVHNMRGKFTDWYVRCAALEGAEKSAAGLPDSVELLPLEASLPVFGDKSPRAPVSPDEIKVTMCEFDVIALTWASPRDGGWELTSRFWCRPASAAIDGAEFTPGPLVGGMRLPSYLAGGRGRLNQLAELFDPHSESWRKLLGGKDEQVQPTLEGRHPSLLTPDKADNRPSAKPATRRAGSKNRKWRWETLDSTLGEEVRLLCAHPQPQDS